MEKIIVYYYYKKNFKSPDLITLEFYLLGYLQKVYQNYYNDLKELPTFITNVIKFIELDVYKTVFKQFKKAKFIFNKKEAYIE